MTKFSVSKAVDDIERKAGIPVELGIKRYPSGPIVRTKEAPLSFTPMRSGINYPQSTLRTTLRKGLKKEIIVKPQLLKKKQVRKFKKVI